MKRSEEAVGRVAAKLRARLVARGYQEKYGIYSCETYAPALKLISIRCTLYVGAQLDLELHKMDVGISSEW